MQTHYSRDIIDNEIKVQIYDNLQQIAMKIALHNAWKLQKKNTGLGV